MRTIAHTAHGGRCFAHAVQNVRHDAAVFGQHADPIGQVQFHRADGEGKEQLLRRERHVALFAVGSKGRPALFGESRPPRGARLARGRGGVDERDERLSARRYAAHDVLFACRRAETAVRCDQNDAVAVGKIPRLILAQGERKAVFARARGRIAAVLFGKRRALRKSRFRKPPHEHALPRPGGACHGDVDFAARARRQALVNFIHHKNSLHISLPGYTEADIAAKPPYPPVTVQYMRPRGEI